MIRVNLLKAKSSSAGRLESLATPRDGTFVTRREVALGGLFLLAGALILFFQFRDEQPSAQALAGADSQASEGDFIDATIGDGTSDASDALDGPDAPDGPSAPAEPAAGPREPGSDTPSAQRLAGTALNPSAPVAPGPGTSPAREASVAADKPSPAPATPPAAEGGKLTQLVVSGGAEALRIFALTGKQPEYSSFRLDRPKRVVVDLKGVRVSLPRSQIQQTVSHAQVKTVRAGQFRVQPPTARLVLDVESYPEIEFLPQFNGLYLVVSGKAQ